MSVQQEGQGLKVTQNIIEFYIKFNKFFNILLQNLN